jgi:hypothetical protein
MAAYGNGMLLNTDTSSSKVGEFAPRSNNLNHFESHLTRHVSHPPFRMPLAERWHLAASWTERHGSGRLLLTREGVHYLLH